MPVLSINNLGHAYGTRRVLDGATFSIEPGEKIGLVGRNGSGKTTLFKAILGELEPDEGSVQLARGARIGYLSQHPTLDPTETLRGEAESAFAELHRLHRELEGVYEAMATADGDELERLLKKQARLESAIETAGGYAIDHRIDATLHGLGFVDAQFSIPVSGLSGGQKARLGLARLLLEGPDVLLLDEPTNHLDIPGRRWLEDFLADEYDGAVIVVSHDRWLLDRVVGRIVEVHLGAIREYPGNYRKFVELRRERQLTDARVYDKQMDKIRREKAFIQKYKTGQRAKQARGRETRLERFKQTELVDRPMELDVMKLALPTPVRSGDQVFTGEGLAKGYGDRTLFEDLSIEIRRGDRIGIIGPNGAGKTTLIRCLLGDESFDAGDFRRGSRLSVGYFSQTHEGLDLSLTTWQAIQRAIGIATEKPMQATEQQARDLAGAFLFSGEEQEKVLSDLSGGERARVILAGLVASGHNVLVLDEPTNHLDIPSAERLEQALGRDGGYEGTLLLISHDRALLQATCDQLIVFDGTGGVRVFLGTYLDWEAKETELARAAEEDRAAATRKKAPPRTKPGGRPKRGGDAGRNGQGPHAKLSLAQLESKIETVEQRIAELDEEMASPDAWEDAKRFSQLQDRRDELTAELRPLEEEWSNRADGS